VSGPHQFAGGSEFGAGAVGDWLAAVTVNGFGKGRQPEQAVDRRKLREVFCRHGFHPDRAERK
jgi:hypothetical protein